MRRRNLNRLLGICFLTGITIVANLSIQPCDSCITKRLFDWRTIGLAGFRHAISGPWRVSASLF